MSDCEFMGNCPIFAKFQTEGLKNYWVNNFCRHGSENCQRKKFRLNGQEVPSTLLPNGSHLIT